MSTIITRNPINRIYVLVTRCFRYLAGDGDDINAADSDEDEDNDDDDPQEAEDEETSFDEDRFCRQVLKVQEKAFARFSVLSHRQRKLLNRLEKKKKLKIKDLKF